MVHEIQKRLAQKYITDFTHLLPANTSAETPFGTVTHTQGKVSSVMINSPKLGEIDFSQDEEGGPMVGRRTYERQPDHTDERDEPVREQVVFPQNEGDLAFLKGVADHLHDNQSRVA